MGGINTLKIGSRKNADFLFWSFHTGMEGIFAGRKIRCKQEKDKRMEEWKKRIHKILSQEIKSMRGASDNSWNYPLLPPPPSTLLQKLSSSEGGII